jgi:hypothetical protein
MEATTLPLDVRTADDREIAEAIRSRGDGFANSVLMRLVRSRRPDTSASDTDEAIGFRIMDALRSSGPDGLTRTELLRTFRQYEASRLNRALRWLIYRDCIIELPGPKPKQGRPATRIRLASHADNSSSQPSQTPAI